MMLLLQMLELTDLVASFWPLQVTLLTMFLSFWRLCFGLYSSLILGLVSSSFTFVGNGFGIVPNSG